MQRPNEEQKSSDLINSDPADPVAPARVGEELPLDSLRPFLQRHFPESVAPVSVEQFPSGHSNLTYLVHLGNKDVVLRRPPFGSTVKSAHDMGREFRVLSKLHGIFPEAPHVFLYCDDLEIIGSPFYVLERIEGLILRKDPPPQIDFNPQVARELSEAFIDHLARLHSIDYSSIGLGDLGKPVGYMARQVRGWIDRYHAAKTHDLPEVPRIASWLEESIPLSGGAALLHNDYKYDNVVLDPSNITRIVGVLDWEMSTIGDPLSDLGTTLAYWTDAADSDESQKVRWCPSNYPGSLTRAGLVERYARITGRDVSSLAFYLAFARFKVAVILQQIYYRYHQGLTHDQRFASMPEKVATLMRASLHATATGII